LIILYDALKAVQAKSGKAEVRGPGSHSTANNDRLRAGFRCHPMLLGISGRKSRRFRDVLLPDSTNKAVSLRGDVDELV
jgi:hypothetical protein